MTCENTCPCLLFAHFTSNQALFEAFEGKKRVHVIDFGMKLGSQWPSLMQALALRPEGPPTFRLTGIGPSSNTDHVQDVGLKLAQLAETLHVEFEYRGVLAETLADIEPAMLDVREGEVVAVNSVFELHQLLARPGEIDKVLTAVKEIKPHIFTVVESSGIVGEGNQDIGEHTCNMFSKEGLEQVKLDQTLAQWKLRFNSGGFESVHLGSNAHKQANILLDLFGGGDGNKVEENDGCLMLCWYAIPLIMLSGWK